MKWGEIKAEILFCREFFEGAREAQELQTESSMEKFREILRRAPPGCDLSRMTDTFNDIDVSALGDGDKLNSFYGVDALYKLCEEGLGVALKIVLEESSELRADLNNEGCGGLSALDYAFEANRPDMAEIMLDAGARPSEKGLVAMVYGVYGSWKNPEETFRWAVPMLCKRGLLENAPECFMKKFSEMEKRTLDSGARGAMACKPGMGGRM